MLYVSEISRDCCVFVTDTDDGSKEKAPLGMLGKAIEAGVVINGVSFRCTSIGSGMDIHELGDDMQPTGISYYRWGYLSIRVAHGCIERIIINKSREYTGDFAFALSSIGSACVPKCFSDIAGIDLFNRHLTFVLSDDVILHKNAMYHAFDSGKLSFDIQRVSNTDALDAVYYALFRSKLAETEGTRLVIDGPARYAKYAMRFSGKQRKAKG